MTQTTEQTQMDIAYALARKCLASKTRRGGEKRLAQALIELSDAAHAVVQLEYPIPNSEMGHPHPKGPLLWQNLRQRIERRLA